MITPHGPIEAGEIADDAVTTAKILDDAITATKMKAAAKTGAMQVRIADISTAETLYLMMPKCTVTRILSVLAGAISVADATITASNKTDAMTAGVITIAESGSASGDIDSCTPTDHLTFDGVADYLVLVGDGGSTTAMPVLVMVEYTLLD